MSNRSTELKAPMVFPDGPTLTREGHMEQEPRFVGIDVSKAQMDVAVRPTGHGWAVPYDDTGVQELVSRMVDLDPALVLLEATGGLELSLVAALAAAALPVVVVNPRQVRGFARATGVMAKTDALDAATWRTSPTLSVPPYVLSKMPRLRSSTPWLPAGIR